MQYFYCFLSALMLTGCIRAPDVVLLDRKTVLEEQASGELHALENELRESVIVPRGIGYTQAQLRESGVDQSRDTLRSIVELHGMMRKEAEFLDDLLVRRCIGEARSGLLTETPSTCAGRTSAARTSAAVDRINRARRQLWRYLQEKQPEAPQEDVRRVWRTYHLRAVVCDGQIQQDDGTWEIKRC